MPSTRSETYTDKLSEKLHSAAQAVGLEKEPTSADKARDAAELAKNNAADAMTQGKDAAYHGACAAKDKVADLGSTAADQMTTAKDNVVESTTSMKDKAAEKLTAIKEAVVDKAGQLKESIVGSDNKEEGGDEWAKIARDENSGDYSVGRSTSNEELYDRRNSVQPDVLLSSA